MVCTTLLVFVGVILGIVDIVIDATPTFVIVLGEEAAGVGVDVTLDIIIVVVGDPPVG